MDPDIIVNGYRVARDMAGGGFFAFRGGGGEGSDMSPHPTLSPDGGGGAPAPPEPTDYDPPRVASEVTITGNKEAVRAATQLLTDQVNRLTPIIAALPNDAVIRFSDGRTMTGAEVKSLWLRTDFTVTDRNFGPDRGGATVGMESVIRFTTVNGYAAHGQAGLSFLIFHEMAHMTDQARDFYAGQFSRYLARRTGMDEAVWISQFDGDETEFRRTEQFANIVALSMMTAAGLTPPSELYGAGNAARTTRTNFPVFGLGVEE